MPGTAASDGLGNGVGEAEEASEDADDGGVADPFEVVERGGAVEVVEGDADFVGGDDGLEVSEGVRVLGEDVGFAEVFDAGGIGEAGADAEEAGVLGPELAGEFGANRAGANERHVAAEDVEELWKFVDFGAAEECADGGDAGVRAEGEGVAGEIDAHGAELEDVEAAEATAGALLAEEDRAGRGKADGEGGGEKDRSDENKEPGREQDIETTFEHKSPREQRDSGGQATAGPVGRIQREEGLPDAGAAGWMRAGWLPHLGVLP